MSSTYTCYASLPLGSCSEDLDWYDDCEVDYAVTSWGSPAQVSGPPEHCYPAEPAEYEALEVRMPDGALLLYQPYCPPERRSQSLNNQIWRSENIDWADTLEHAIDEAIYEAICQQEQDDDWPDYEPDYD